MILHREPKVVFPLHKAAFDIPYDKNIIQNRLTAMLTECAGSHLNPKKSNSTFFLTFTIIVITIVLYTYYWWIDNINAHANSLLKKKTFR